MRYGSLCSGIGGLDLAVEALWDASPAWFCEADTHAARVLERHWPGVPILPDIKTQDWTSVEPVELITAGYPCQPFSHAGRRQGTDDPRHLWPFVIDAVRILGPRYVVLENVAGHLGLGFDTVLGDLAEAGFDAEWTVVPASAAGACHRRERLFVVAHAGHGAGALARDAAWAEARAERLSDQDGGSRAVPPAADASGPRTGRDGSGALGAQEPGRRGAQGHTDPPGVHRCPVADAERERREGTLSGARGDDGRNSDTAWGDYEPAIRRWEHVLGRPAPAPTDDRGRLSVSFVEWMQGFDDGWVDGLTRTAALRCLGNAVVPQQGVMALGTLVRDSLARCMPEGRR